MSNYTMKTASLKSTILLSSIVLVGDTTLISKRGINTNNIVADSIKTSDEDPYLTKSVADSLYGGSSLSYDWAPALELKIQFSLLEGESYTVPSNGWFVVNEKEINEGSVWIISINQRPMFHSDNNGLLHVLVLVKMGDVITSNSNTSRNGYFVPCVSELRDWRIEELKSDADIWKNAVVHNADGTTTVRDQWLDNGSEWFNTYGDTYQTTLSYIKNDEAFDADGNHLFYIQTENIKDGREMFRSSSITSFIGDLSNLISGHYMFYGSDIEHFRANLASLRDGSQMFAVSEDGEHTEQSYCNLDKDSVLHIIKELKYHNTLPEGETAYFTIPLKNSLRIDPDILSELVVSSLYTYDEDEPVIYGWHEPLYVALTSASGGKWYIEYGYLYMDGSSND